MKKFIIFLLLLVLGSVTFAQQLVVMVPPFELVSGVTKAEADTITRLFIGNLSKARVVTVVNTANLKQRMDAMKWEMSDWSSKEKKAKLNEGINADYLNAYRDFSQANDLDGNNSYADWIAMALQKM